MCPGVPAAVHRPGGGALRTPALRDRPDDGAPRHRLGRARQQPFFTLSPGETLIGVQFLILAAALPHLALAAAIDERRQALDDVAARLDFERLLGQLAHAFLDAPTDPAGDAYPDAIREVGERLDFDAVVLLRREGQGLVVTGAWFRTRYRHGHLPPFPGAL